MADTVHSLDAKDPGEVLDYTWDFTNLLEAAEEIDAINSVTVTPVTSPPLTVDSQGIDAGGKKVTVYLSSGVVCTKYTVSINVTTDASTARVFERSCIIPVEDR
jgi:hypothetical protein